VSTARPLRLKSQEATRLDSQQASTDPYIKVWVDTSVSHLDGSFDYLVPERLSDQVRPGVRIGVPFAGRDVEALVLERSSSTEVTNLKFISSVISPEVVAPEKLIELIAAVSKRWICNPYDLVRAAIPARVASVDKSKVAGLQESTPKTLKKSSQSNVFYLQLQPHEDSLEKLAEFALKESLKGSVLIVLPEERELLEVSKLLGDKAIVLSSALTRTERYANYLAALKTETAIVIGTRSSIFVTPRDLRTLIIYRENSQSHYEVRHPGWNVRDIALMRAESESLNLYFVGYSPSLEMAALIESSGAKYLSKKLRLSVKTFTPQNSELLPERIFTHIRSALKNGPVLFLVPKKGYASALMCKKCKNIAICSCGGKLSRRNQSSPPECVHCSKTYPTWSCSWCNEDKLILLGRGSIRHAEEIGRAFPGFAVINSDADGVTKEISDQRTLVIATAGMAPSYAAGYSAVVFLEGASFFSYSDLRGQERSREAFFEAASKVRNGGEVLIAIDSSHPVVASLATWSPAHMYKRELMELESLNLPPFYRSVYLDVPVKEASAIAEGLKKSLLEQRIPDSSRILGPAIRNPETARVLVTASISDFPQLTQFLAEYIKHRAITKKSAIELRIDPYSLS
jgi:primosomal protein N' (replication factor Y)